MPNACPDRDSGERSGRSRRFRRRDVKPSTHYAVRPKQLSTPHDGWSSSDTQSTLPL